ncbi:MAG: EF2563 family selenium-dependent molybdenum hydroxylase system protein [Spirochaetales bacterium]|nr:EF2563 family selenium-dependent molybdenum hydroxylase system protein [Spirochaetales bacterium]
MNTTVLQQASNLSEHKQAFVFVIILKSEGSTSRSQGAMVVDQEGIITGTIGGGETEAYAQHQALDLLSSQEQSRHLSFTVRQGEISDAGKVHLLLLTCNTESMQKAFIQFRSWEANQLQHVMGVQLQPSLALMGLCEGGATIGDVHPKFLEQAHQVLENGEPRFIETNNWICHMSLPVKAHNLLLIGGGHVNQAIAHLSHAVGLPVQILETRTEFATEVLFPFARKRIVAETVKQALAEATITTRTLCVIASHAFDEESAKLLLDRDIAYLGVLGSRHKAKKLASSLHSRPQAAQKLYCPIGLDLGSETPQEIAVSALAEIMKVMNHATGTSLRNMGRKVVLVRGGGDLATGVILRLHRSGYRAIVLETEQPSVIRTTVSLAQAMYGGTVEVEGITAQRCANVKEAFKLLEEDIVPVLADPTMECLDEVAPVCLVDAIMAKRNLGTHIDDAPLVIALGPGFEAGVDCDLVIETKRGHSLGRILREGSAIPNTGIPGLVNGFGKERVLHSPKDGIFKSEYTIGALVHAGEVIATVDGEPILAPIDGKLRGLLNSGLPVTKHFKVADIDPRGDEADHTTVSEKAYAIGGAVLEALDGFLNRA